MLLDKSDIEKIAWLARLAIAPDDIPEYSRDLSNILAMVKEMEHVNTAEIEPLAHPLELSARLRDDVVTEIDQRQYFQQIAQEVSNGHYLVPKVIE
jgi:aspartyl-tRNA(Asn)/glutamyl-tRNA(Gln) amidotransferase subunit C